MNERAGPGLIDWALPFAAIDDRKTLLLYRLDQRAIAIADPQAEALLPEIPFARVEVGALKAPPARRPDPFAQERQLFELRQLGLGDHEFEFGFGHNRLYHAPGSRGEQVGASPPVTRVYRSRRRGGPARKPIGRRREGRYGPDACGAKVSRGRTWVRVSM